MAKAIDNTSQGLPQSKEELYAKLKAQGAIDTAFQQKMFQIWATEPLLSYIERDLEKRVKRDRPTKFGVLSTGTSTLTVAMNLFPKGETGIGKTYNAVETLRYFPEEDIWFLGGASPKSLIRDYGVLMDKNGEEINLEDAPEQPKRCDYDDKEEYREAVIDYKAKKKQWRARLKDSYTLIDLTGKIITFLEAPEEETFRMLYPILSHDKERISYRVVVKSESGAQRTAHIIIQGWPACIFLSVDRRYMEELSTRGFTTTPESSSEKISDANQLTSSKVSFPWNYEIETDESKVIRQLILSLKKEFLTKKLSVIIPFPNLYELFPREIVRDMRDYQHFVQFAQTITALFLYQRPIMTRNGKSYLIASVRDVKQAAILYKAVFETTRTNTEQRILDFYYNFVIKNEKNYVKDLTADYNADPKTKRKLSDYTIRNWLERLNQISYVDKREDKEDRRVNFYVPVVKERKEEIFETLFNSENKTDSTAKLVEGFNSWKNDICKTDCFTRKEIFNGEWTDKPITLEEVEKISLHTEPIDLQISEKEESKPNSETTAETERKGENKEVSNILEGLVSKVAKLERLHGNFEDRCLACRKFGRMGFQINFHDETWTMLCDPCGLQLAKLIGEVKP
jgi:hypothetical protein